MCTLSVCLANNDAKALTYWAPAIVYADDISAKDADCASAPDTTIKIPHVRALGPPLYNDADRFLVEL